MQAAAEGVPIDELIARNPMKALHWIQSAARRKAQSSDPNRGAYAALRSRALPVIENNVPGYRALRKDYASNEGLDKAKTFGDKLFGGANSQAIQNPGMRAELVASGCNIGSPNKGVSATGSGAGAGDGTASASHFSVHHARHSLAMLVLCTMHC